MIYRIFAFLTIVAVIVASLLLSSQQSGTPASTTVQQTGWDAGYSARNARLVQTSGDGAPLYTLTAATIRQQPNEDRVKFTQVQMSFRDRNGNAWTATADSGELEQSSQQVELSGDVHVSGAFRSGASPAQISTDALSVDLHRDIVSTRQPVTLLWSGLALDSTGLVADLKDQRVHLESDVHATFTK
ncbi:MAG TPA: LPS export ABC transporter periplasmic protein LptC [Steroidobacteraceae bacterium]|nr:LPS export ABC transporter periplasmic protein LptC [Steroidobacteraceae bacterium]